MTSPSPKMRRLGPPKAGHRLLHSGEDGQMAPPQGDWMARNAAWIGIAIGILLNFGTTVWWASRIDARVTAIERSDALQQAYESRITRLETSGADVARRLDRIEGKIDRILDDARK